MHTWLIYSDSLKNLELARKKLIMKYSNIDDLFQDIQRERCSDPDKVDDYMLWHSINTFDKEQQELERLDAGNMPPIIFREELLYQTTDFFGILTPRRMELLEYIHTHNPKSLKTLAEETGRDYKNVYDDVLALQRFRLLELIKEGKNKRPFSNLTAMEIQFKK